MSAGIPIKVRGASCVELQFSTEAAVSSAMIRWFTHSEFSHVDFVLPDGMLFGARPEGGVVAREPGYANFSRTKNIRIVTDKADAIYTAALSQNGKPYDSRSIAAFVFPSLHSRRHWRDRGQWFCSEMCAWSFESARFFANPISLPVSGVTPGDLDLLLSPFAETLLGWRPADHGYISRRWVVR